MQFDQIALMIVTIGNICLALYNILKFTLESRKIQNNVHKTQFHNDFTAEMDQHVVEYLEKNEDFISEVVCDVVREVVQDEINSKFDSINTSLSNLTNQVTEIATNVGVLTAASKDLLREQIMKIYRDGYQQRTLTIGQREELDQYYEDYKREHGNSFIDKFYHRMDTWNVIDMECHEFGEG